MRIILCGATGKMGRAIQGIAERSPHEIEIVAGTARSVHDRGVSFPLYASPRDAREDADAAICFAPAASLPDVLDACLRRRLPLVCGSTGLGEDHIRRLRELADAVPVFFSPNMSFFMHAVESAVRGAAALAGSVRSIAIHEVHHRDKRDAPSGTALRLEGTIREGFADTPLRIESERIDTTHSEHTIAFQGDGESIAIRHVCESRDVYAQTAIQAAAFLVTRRSGWYAMDDLFAALHGDAPSIG